MPRRSTISAEADGVPSGVMLPTYLMEGPLTWPGQTAGFLGPKHDPWQIKQDPNARNFQVDNLGLPVASALSVCRSAGASSTRSNPARFAEHVSGERSARTSTRPGLFLLLSGKVARAFQLEREDPRVRDRYGPHTYGQSLLLSRRLVQAGVPICR